LEAKMTYLTYYFEVVLEGVGQEMNRERSILCIILRHANSRQDDHLDRREVGVFGCFGCRRLGKILERSVNNQHALYGGE